MLAACKRAEKEQQAITEKILKKSFKAEKNKVFIQSAFHSNNLNSESSILKTENTNIKNKDDWKNDANKSQYEK